MKKVLFLASWYPNRNHASYGLFIKKHAEAVANFTSVYVLSVLPDYKNRSIYEVDEYFEKGIYTLIIYFKKSKIPLFKNIINRYRYIKSGIIGFKRIVKKFGKPDILHINVIWYIGVLGLILKKIYNIQYVITEHWTGYLLKSKKKFGFLKNLLIKIIIRNSKGIIVVSTALKKDMIKRGFKGNYFVVPNVAFEKTPVVYEKENTKKNKKIMLHISFLRDEAKNVSGIIKAIKNISLLRNDFELHIIGDGIDRRKLEKMAEDMDILNKYVFFHGLLSNEKVKEFLINADFLVMNSNYETFSVVSIEAISCGIPVIITKCGGPEDFINEEVGILIEPNNQKQLEEAIIYMLDNYKNYKRENLMKYGENFNSFNVGKKIYEIYKLIFNFENLESTSQK